MDCEPVAPLVQDVALPYLCLNVLHFVEKPAVCSASANALLGDVLGDGSQSVVQVAHEVLQFACHAWDIPQLDEPDLTYSVVNARLGCGVRGHDRCLRCTANVNRPKGTGGSKGSAYRLVGGRAIEDDQPMGKGTAPGGFATEDGGLDDSECVVDEVTGLANRLGFLEILRMEERRHARYGGSPMLFLVDVRRAVAQRQPSERDDLLVEVAGILADCLRDTDTLARVDDERFAILAIQAGADASSIVGRLRLHLELRRIHQSEVTIGESGSLADTWQALTAPPARPRCV